MTVIPSSVITLVSRIKYNTHNIWNFVSMILNIILICSLSLSSVNGSTLDFAKVVNTEYGNSKNFKIVWMKQNYAYHSIQDLNQAAEKKNATNKIIIVPSLENRNQLSSITKKD